MSRQILIDIAHSGIQAPSADNRHVFTFDIGHKTIGLWPSPEFLTNKERHRHILNLLSLGAIIENMRLHASQNGLKTNLRWGPANTTRPVVVLEFETASIGPDADLAMQIPLRHTNRKMYEGPPLSPAELAELNAAVLPVKNVQLRWLKGPQRRLALGMIWKAESERFLRKRLHEEIFSSIRFDLSWNVSAGYAIPPGSLEIEAPMRRIFKSLRHWSTMKPLTKIGLHRVIGLRAGWLPCWQAPGLAVLSTSLSPELGAVEVGAAFQRIWLRATALRLALQPLAASVVLPLQESTPEDMGASAHLRSQLNSGWAQICPGDSPLMLFRVGRASQPRVRAGRSILAHHMKPDPSADD